MDRCSFLAVVACIVMSRIASYYAASVPVPVASMPKGCEGKTFCAHPVDNYPQALIDSLLDGVEGLFRDYNETIGDRSNVNEFKQPKDECKSKTYMRPIQAIVDEHNRVRFVVQSEKKFKQIIRIEECENQNSRLTEPTLHISKQTVDTFQLVCHQCMLQFKFLVLAMDAGSLEVARVKGGLPVCCSCRQLLES